MPLILIPIAGLLGVGGGFLAANGVDKVVKLALVAGAGYVAYNVYVKA